jgi:AcrR family transcriptional regulator
VISDLKKEVNDVRKSRLEPLSIKVTDKRKVRHDQRRQRYLSEAMKLVIEEGLEGLTIARLASRMKGSNGAIYRYFPSKESLMVSLQELAIADFHALMIERLERLEEVLPKGVSAQVRALARLGSAFESYVAHGDSSPRPHRLVDAFLSSPEAVLSDVEAAGIAERLVSPILDQFASALAEAEQTGAIEPGDRGQRTHLAWAIVHGLDHFKKRDRINPPELQVHSLLPAARRSYLRGLGASPETIGLAELVILPVV